MHISIDFQIVVPTPPVSVNGTPNDHGIRNERHQIGARSVKYMSHPHSSEPLGLLHLYSYYHNTLACSTSSLSADFNASGQGLINLYVPRQLVSILTNHCHTVTLKHGPRYSVTDAHGALHGLGRQSVFCRSKMPSSLEPCSERRTCLIQNRACGNCRLMTARRTHETAPSMTPRHGACGTCRAYESVFPSQLLQVRNAGCVIREHCNELSVGGRVILPGNQCQRQGDLGI